jgi:hypothetical protein
MPSNEPGPRARRPRRAVNEPEPAIARVEPGFDIPGSEPYPDSPGSEPYLGDQEEYDLGSVETDLETLESDPSPGDPGDSDGFDGEPDPDGQDAPEPDGPEAQLDLDSVVVSLVESMRDAVQRVTAADSAAGHGRYRAQGPDERERDQVVLQYNALRTALGRPGAAALVLYRVVSRWRERSGGTQVGIEIASGAVSAGDWIVLYGGAGSGGQTGSEIGRAEYCPDGKGTAWVPVDVADPVVSRLEVWDHKDGRPIRLGYRLVDGTRYSANPARR